jgi:hypothetical protein
MRRFFKFAFLTLAIACQSSDSERFDYNYNKAIIEDYLMAEALYADFFRLTLKAETDTAIIESNTATIDSALVIKSGATYTFNYGANQKCPDGSIRSGSFRITKDAPIFDSLAIAQVTFDNLMINSKNILGSLTIKNLSGNNQPQFSVVVNQGIIQLNDAYSSVVEYSSKLKIKFKKGFTTPIFYSDDLFYVTGTSSGKAHQFDRFTSSIQDTVAFSNSCRFFRGGLNVLTMPDFEINEARIEYNAVTACSATVKVVYKGTTPSGDRITSQPQSINITF